MKINLTATNKQEELILAYLQENASETLADKINNGTPFEKDGKPLINKKTLSGFMKYACDEARKLAEKGASSACVDDATVYGWAIHYFEEDSIEGTLYTIDGEEYKPAPKKVAPITKQTAKTSVVSTATPVVSSPQNKQESLFDMLTAQSAAKETAVRNTADESDQSDDEPTKEDFRETAEYDSNEESEKTVPAETKTKGPNLVYTQYKQLKERYFDCVIAYRLGDFYEILGKDAVALASKLDMILTSRDCGLEKRIPMIGFPYHAAENYIAKMIALGYKVAVAEAPGNVDVREQLSPAASVDEETGEIIYDDLSESEMREFDGDISETQPLVAANSDSLSAEEKELAKAFDTEALCALSELLGDDFILV